MLQTTGLVLLVAIVTTHGNDIHQERKSQKELTPSASQNGSCDLQLLINSTNNLVAILNSTAAGVIVFDVTYSYTAIFHGSTANVILVDLESKKGLFIAGNSSRVGWIAQSQSFEEFFKSLSSLKSIFECNENNGQKFTLGDVNPDIVREVKLVLIAHSRNEYYISQDLVVHYFVSFSDVFVKTLKGPLNGVLNILRSGVRSIGISARAVVVIFHTIGEVVHKVKRGVSVLAEINFDWNRVFYTRSWRTIFYDLFSKLKEHNVDVKPILAEYKEDFALLMSSFAGNVTHGNDGVLRIVAELRRLVLGKPSADYLVIVLLEFFTHSGSNGATYEEFVKQILQLADFYKQIGVADVMQPTIRNIHRFQQRNYVDNGIDVYKITYISFESSKVPLQSIVEILSLVQKSANIQSSIAFLLDRLISLVLDRSVSEIRSLVPAVRIDCSEDFLVYVFHGTKVSDLQGDLYEFLKSRPVIGQMLEIIDSTLKTCNNKSLQEIIGSPTFCKYWCRIIKSLGKVVEEVNQKCGYGGDSERHLKSRYYVSRRHLGLAEKHYEKHHEKHRGHDKQHRERHGHGNGKHHKERINHNTRQKAT